MTDLPDPTAKIRVTRDALREFLKQLEASSVKHRVVRDAEPGTKAPTAFFCGHELVVDDSAKCIAFDIGVPVHIRAQFFALVAPNGVAP